MRIWLSDPSRVDELAGALEQAGCTTERTGAQTLAAPADEPESALVFFVKAWRRRYPAVRVRLTRPTTCLRAREIGRAHV